MRLSTAEWRVVRQLDEAGKRRVSRSVAGALMWLTALALVDMCVVECLRIRREARAHQVTLHDVVSPTFDGLAPKQANQRHGIVVSITLRSALVVLYFFLASFLFSVAIGMRVYKRQDAVAARLVKRLRELDELE